MKVFVIILVVILSLLLIFFLFIAPGRKKSALNSKWLLERLIIHRGYFDNQNVMENSLKSFEKVIAKGYNLETDVSLTKDNEVIVFHDDNFLRLCHVDSKVKDLTLKEILELSYLNNDKISTFRELLSFVDQQIGLVIELKSTNDFKKDQILCQKVLECLKDYGGKYALISFSPFILRYLKKNYPYILRGQLYTKVKIKEEFKKRKGQGFKGFLEVIGLMFYNAKLINFISRPHFFLQEYDKRDLMSVICSFFMKEIIFTIKDEEGYEHYIKKCSNLIIENIEVDKYGRAKSSIS